MSSNDWVVVINARILSTTINITRGLFFVGHKYSGKTNNSRNIRIDPLEFLLGIKFFYTLDGKHTVKIQELLPVPFWGYHKKELSIYDIFHQFTTKRRSGKINRPEVSLLLRVAFKRFSQFTEHRVLTVVLEPSWSYRKTHGESYKWISKTFIIVFVSPQILYFYLIGQVIATWKVFLQEESWTGMEIE